MRLSKGQLCSIIREEVAALSQAPKRREKREKPDPYLPDAGLLKRQVNSREVELISPTQGLAQHMARTLGGTWNTGRGGYIVTATVPISWKLPNDWHDEGVRLRLKEARSDWDDLPRTQRMSSVARDEEAALVAGEELLQALDRLGDYEHYDQVNRLLSSMRKTYGKF